MVSYILLVWAKISKPLTVFSYVWKFEQMLDHLVGAEKFKHKQSSIEELKKGVLCQLKWASFPSVLKIKKEDKIIKIINLNS